MSYTDEIFSMAQVFTGELSEGEQGVLRTVCEAAQAELTARLRPDVSPEDCGKSLISAACWLAIAIFSAGRQPAEISSFTAGELSLTFGASGTGAECLRTQAELIMSPYISGGFSVKGVRG